jgi:DNA-binding CsgD family transcriptional regulator
LLAQRDVDRHWVRAVAQLSVARWGGGDRLAPVLMHAAEVAERDRDSVALRLLRLPAAVAAAHDGDVREVRRLMDEDLAEGDGFVAMLAGTASATAVALCGADADVDELEAGTRAACRLGGVSHAATSSHAAFAIVLHRRGRDVEARRSLQESDGRGDVRSTMRLAAALIARDAGDADRLGAIAEEVLDTRGAPFLGLLVACLQGEVEGDWPAVHAAARACLDATPGVSQRIEPLVAMVAAACARADADEVARPLGELGALVGALPASVPHLVARVAVLRARVHLLDGAVGDAEDAIRVAITAVTAASNPLPLCLVDALEVASLVARARGDARRARRLLGAADSARAQLRYACRYLTGAVVTEDDVRSPWFAEGRRVGLADAARWCERRGRRGRESGPRALTPTERLVAARVAEGLANERVAHELGVSVATVKTHLTHVYAKLGVTNRTQLAVHVLRARRSAPAGAAPGPGTSMR